MLLLFFLVMFQCNSLLTISSSQIIFINVYSAIAYVSHNYVRDLYIINKYPYSYSYNNL